jgi:pyruvate dehydrogenase E2 component (dihydrolipoamide acetyltransferase)
MQTVVMPKLGDTMEEGKILNWLKQEGDQVAKGDPLAEIETEKVTIPVESFAEGVLRKILVPAGETVPVGTPIALTGTADEPLPAEATQAEAPAAAAPTAATPATAPEPGGQAGAAPEQLAPQPITQPATEPQRVGAQPAASAVASAQTGAPPAPPVEQPVEQPVEHDGRVFVSPIARRIAQEHHLDLRQIQGTGPGGRIIREDVELALSRQGAQAPAAPAAVTPPAPPVPPAAPGEAVQAVPLSQMRKTIARRLQQSMQAAPHFYVTMSVDATKLGAFRTQVNDYAATLPEPIKVSVNDLIVKGVATTLARMPQVNVSFDGERLLFKKQINVGVAVALEQGLIVPVLRDADKRGVLEIARESRRLVDAARTGKLRPEEFQGGTFSVSNLGMYDVDEFTAIINPPESAILAVGAIIPTPVVRDGQVVVRDVMKLTLSVDHRALDGATAARFLQELKRLLEEPLSMLL